MEAWMDAYWPLWLGSMQANQSLIADWVQLGVAAHLPQWELSWKLPERKLNQVPSQNEAYWGLEALSLPTAVRQMTKLVHAVALLAAWPNPKAQSLLFQGKI